MLWKKCYVEKIIETIEYIDEHEGQGDILAFLTGQAEIEYVCSRIRKPSLTVFGLYSSLDMNEQRKVFEKTRNRKVVVSTNIAATSITIEGIKFVIDCGFVKEKIFDPKTGMDSLLVVPISQSAAIQRSGRAGRTSHGKSFRLYCREVFENQMAVDTIPEIQRTSLTGVVLCMLSMGVKNVLEFDFMDPPERFRLEDAFTELKSLGAIENGELTDLGKQMASLPLSPKLSCALISSCKNGCGKQAIMLASILSVEEIWNKPRGGNDLELRKAQQKYSHPSGDHWSLILLFDLWKERGSKWARENYLSHRAFLLADSIAHQLKESIRKLGLEIGDCQSPIPLLKSWCVAFSTCIAKKHPQSLCFYMKSNQSNVTLNIPTVKTSENHLLALYLHPFSFLDIINDDTIEWVMYHQVIMSNRAIIKYVSKINYDWVSGREEFEVPEIEKKVVTVADNVKKTTEKIESAKERYLKRKNKKN